MGIQGIIDRTENLCSFFNLSHFHELQMSCIYHRGGTLPRLRRRDKLQLRLHTEYLSAVFISIFI